MRMDAVIWDLDGTLIDSYRCIVPSLRLFYEARGVSLDEEQIRSFVLQDSVTGFARFVEAQYGVSLSAEMEEYRKIRGELEKDLQLMPGARALLDRLKAAGVRSFLFTHRGPSTEAVLRRVGLEADFEEVLTAESGFPRKPAPDAILYLLQRHQLSPEGSCYVGDRPLDIQCAVNAGIQAVLYAPEGDFLPPEVPHVSISSLAELGNLIEN